MDPATIAGLSQAAISLIGLFKGNQGDDPFQSPELQRLLRLQMGRMQGQNPLFESVAKMAHRRLPMSARQGIPEPSLQWAESQMGPRDGDSNLPPELREILRNTELRYHLTDPLYRSVSQLVGSRMPMGLQPPPGQQQQWDYNGAPLPPVPEGPPPPVPTEPEYPDWPGDDRQVTFSNTPANNPWAVDYGRY